MIYTSPHNVRNKSNIYFLANHSLYFNANFLSSLSQRYKEKIKMNKYFPIIKISSASRSLFNAHSLNESKYDVPNSLEVQPSGIIYSNVITQTSNSFTIDLTVWGLRII